MSAYTSNDLREPVSFYREVSTPDGVGGYSKSLEKIASVRALVRPMSGRERAYADAIEASSNYFIVIRYRDDIAASTIAEWNSKKLNIRFVRDRGPRSHFLEIEAEMGVAH